jgi:alpha-1,2-mannosyltransferase
VTTELPTRSQRALSPSLTYVVTGVLMVATALYLVHWGRAYGLDLHVYRDGIASWRSGHNPYNGVFTVRHLRFTYPPFALVALSPLAWAPFAVTQALLWALSVLALALAVDAVVLVEPVRTNLDYGQINTLLLGLVVVDLLVMPKAHSGWLIGLAAAIKVTPLIFVAVPLLERDWKAVARSLGALAGTTALTWLFWPNATKTYWAHDLWAAKRVGNIAYAGNQSLSGMLHRWPFPSDGQAGILLVLCVAAVLMGFYVAHRRLSRGDRTAAMLALALVGLLISPISWTHHWVWVALIPPLLLTDGGRSLPGPARSALWALCAVSILAPYWWFTTGLAAEVLADSLVLTGLGVLVVWSRSEYRARAGAPVAVATAR